MNKLSDGIIDVSVSISLISVSILFLFFDVLLLVTEFNFKHILTTLIMIIVVVIQILDFIKSYKRLKQEESENILNFDYLVSRVRHLEEIAIKQNIDDTRFKYE